MATRQANSLLPGCKHIRRASHNWKRLKIGESPFAALVEDEEEDVGPIVEDDNDDGQGQVEERQDQHQVNEEPTLVEEEPEEIEAVAAPAEVPLRRSARVQAREQARANAAPRRSPRIARLREEGRLPVSYRE